MNLGQASCCEVGILGFITNGSTRRLERNLAKNQARLADCNLHIKSLNEKLRHLSVDLLKQAQVVAFMEGEMQDKGEKLQELRVTSMIEKESKELLKQELELLRARHADLQQQLTEQLLQPPLPPRPISPPEKELPPEITPTPIRRTSVAATDMSAEKALGIQRENLETLGQDLKELLRQKDTQIQMLKNQLASVGQAPIDEVLSLAEAEARLRKCVQRLMAGEERAQAEFDKYDKIIRNHPDKVAEEQNKMREWVDKNDGPNQEALRVMRTFVPPDIWSTSLPELKRRGLTDAQATRVWQKKALWLCRSSREHIQKMHEADLRARSYMGLDIIELRAFYCALPITFDSDPAGRKTQWRSDVFDKLLALVVKSDAGQLTKAQKRTPCYGMSIGPFDPDAANVAPAMASAASNGPIDGEMAELRLTLRTLRSEASGSPQASPRDSPVPTPTARPPTPIPSAPTSIRRGGGPPPDAPPSPKPFLSALTATRVGRKHADEEGAAPAASPKSPAKAMAGGLMAELGLALRKTKRAQGDDQS